MKENENKEDIRSQENQDTTISPQADSANEPEASNRRELILRYGKYALVAAPLLMFVSKAQAIHSRP
ncbi:hypothetical protein [Paracidobacterium acidisoli]|uniref:Uncharacterized protein n=1 Tax=Paracidobacterium acidisoli TaxID=2303751 RepID=A0A372IK96_9BACT|nr:hypothetical protein [Paracidobacterium acidisoli]MBT9332637.1 hypothetical protein [Paracidobacterium acidisoli]